MCVYIFWVLHNQELAGSAVRLAVKTSDSKRSLSSVPRGSSNRSLSRPAATPTLPGPVLAGRDSASRGGSGAGATGVVLPTLPGVPHRSVRVRQGTVTQCNVFRLFGSSPLAHLNCQLPEPLILVG
jgi:hypothetical protein